MQRASQIGAVKLLESSGVYFKGDEANEKLQRIYGTAFATREGARGVREGVRGGARARSPPARARARPLQLLAAGAGFAVLSPQGRRGLQRPDRLRARAQRRHGYGEVDHAADPRRRALEHLRALRELPREHVLHRGRRAAVRGQADELPDPLPDLRHAASAPTATCRSATPTSAGCTATSAAASPPASPGCAPSRRTTPTSSAPRSRSTQRCRAAVEMILDDLPAPSASSDVEDQLSARGPEKRIGTDEQWDAAEAALREGARVEARNGSAYSGQPRRRRLLRARRSTSRSRTRSAAGGSSAPSSSTTSCRSASTSSTSRADGTVRAGR